MSGEFSGGGLFGGGFFDTKEMPDAGTKAKPRRDGLTALTTVVETADSETEKDLGDSKSKSRLSG